MPRTSTISGILRRHQDHDGSLPTFEAIKDGKLTLTPIRNLRSASLQTQQPPSKLGVAVGAQILSVESALKAVIIKSANDISVVLAEAISGSRRPVRGIEGTRQRASRHDPHHVRQPQWNACSGARRGDHGA